MRTKTTRKRADLLLHPARLRIMAAVAGRAMTTAQLAAALPDMAQATLYRHVRRLHEAGALVVVAEREAHGALERTFAVAPGHDRIGPDELASATRAEHERYFTIFIGSLLAEFSNHVRRAKTPADVMQGLAYNTINLYLTPAELDQLRQTLTTAVGRAMQHEPGPGRRRYALASVFVPSPE
jgi:DNA-binding transcriptional ArsR family regulator